MCAIGSIGEAIEKAGGKYSNATKLADDVTHLVVTEEHWKKGKNTPKGEGAFLLVSRAFILVSVLY